MTTLDRDRKKWLLLRIAGIGLASGVGAGMTLMLAARLGFGALLGDLTLYLVMLGAGWFTGRVLDGELLRVGGNSSGARDWLILPAGFAILYAAGVDALDALLVEVTLTGAWAMPALVLAAVAAALGATLGYRLRQLIDGTRPVPAVALAGVAAIAIIVCAINLLAWHGAQNNGPGTPNALMLIGVWAGYFVPGLWLAPVAAFALWPALRR